MKKIILNITLLCSIIGFSQEFKIEDKSISNIYIIDNRTKAELYSSINRWVAINYNSAQNVVQLNDAEAGTIVVKGINSIIIRNAVKDVMPNNPYVLDTQSLDFHHILEFNIKDNKFRVTYRITEDSANFVNYKEAAETVDFTGGMKKPGIVSQKRWDKTLKASKDMYIDTNDELIKTIKERLTYIDLSIKKDELKEKEW